MTFKVYDFDFLAGKDAEIFLPAVVASVRDACVMPDDINKILKLTICCARIFELGVPKLIDVRPEALVITTSLASCLAGLLVIGNLDTKLFFDETVVVNVVSSFCLFLFNTVNTGSGDE